MHFPSIAVVLAILEHHSIHLPAYFLSWIICLCTICIAFKCFCFVSFAAKWTTWSALVEAWIDDRFLWSLWQRRWPSCSWVPAGVKCRSAIVDVPCTNIQFQSADTDADTASFVALAYTDWLPHSVKSSQSLIVSSWHNCVSPVTWLSWHAANPLFKCWKSRWILSKRC